MTKDEVAKMMLEATSRSLAQAQANYASFENTPNCAPKRAAKKEVMRLLRRSLAEQEAIHSPFKGH